MHSKTEDLADKAEDTLQTNMPQTLGPVMRFAQEYPLLTGAITYAFLSTLLACVVGKRTLHR